MAGIQQRSVNNVNNQKEIKVFIGVPTGPPKKYALGYMTSALQQLTYQNVEIHFAVTQYKYKCDSDFLSSLKLLIKALNLPIILHYTYVSEMDEKHSFRTVLKNLQLLRRLFLDGDYTHFLLLGGDNPPIRDTVERLLKLDCDVATAVLYQRPDRMRGTSVPGQPMLWFPSWTIKDLEKHKLDPLIVDDFKTAFECSSLLIPLVCDPCWKRRKVLEGVVGGSGCMLVRRRVFERVGFTLPHTGYHSEDIHFYLKCLLRGFKVKADLKFHAPHLAPNGQVY